MSSKETVSIIEEVIRHKFMPYVEFQVERKLKELLPFLLKELSNKEQRQNLEVIFKGERRAIG